MCYAFMSYDIYNSIGYKTCLTCALEYRDQEHNNIAFTYISG